MRCARQVLLRTLRCQRFAPLMRVAAPLDCAAFSKMVIYFEPHTDKLATTILPFYLEAAATYGCPDTVVSDYGAESALIAFVNHAAKEQWEASTGLSSTRRAYHFTKSVHNVRVERFWNEPNTRITWPMIVRAAALAALAPLLPAALHAKLHSWRVAAATLRASGARADARHQRLESAGFP